MPRNVEVKAILKDRAAVLTSVASKSDGPSETIVQRDFFFRCRDGRLKLRVFESGRGELIRYEREDVAGARFSHYQIAPTSDPEVLLDILTQALGRIGEVKKTRILYLIGQTRVHVDRVEGLGDFVELEVVLRPGQSQDDGKQIAEGLLAELGIEKNQLVAEAYVDLLVRQKSHPSSLGCGQ